MNRLLHIAAIMKSSNGVTVKLLGETHRKTPEEKYICDTHINDSKVKHIFHENWHLTCIERINYNFEKFLLSRYHELTEGSSIQHAFDKNNNKGTENLKNDIIKSSTYTPIMHDMEEHDKEYWKDSVDTTFGLTTLALFPFYKIAPKIIIPIMMCTTIMYSRAIPLEYIFKKSDYKTRSWLSQLTLYNTKVYRRDKIMADNIMSFIKDKNPNDKDIVLCMFGAGHFEEIVHYLHNNGFKFIEEPTRF